MLSVVSETDVAEATLRIGDLTTRFRVKRQTIYRWMKFNGFPKPVTINPRVIRWKPSDVDAWAVLHAY